MAARRTISRCEAPLGRPATRGASRPTASSREGAAVTSRRASSARNARIRSSLPMVMTRPPKDPPAIAGEPVAVVIASSRHRRP